MFKCVSMPIMLSFVNSFFRLITCTELKSRYHLIKILICNSCAMAIKTVALLQVKQE